MPDSDKQPSIRWDIPEVFILVLGMLFVGAFLYSIHPVLTPFVLFGAAALLLYRDRHIPQIRRILWVVCLLFVVWFFASLLGVLIPFFIALLLAYLLNPLVDMLGRRKIKRWQSSLFLVALMVTGIGVGFALFIPVLIGQGGNIISGISHAVREAMGYYRGGRLVHGLIQMGIPADKANQLISVEIPSRLEGILTGLLGGMLTMISSVFDMVSRLLDIVIIVLVTYYLLKDFPPMIAGIRKRIPDGYAGMLDQYAARADEILGNYIRGTLTIAAIQGTGIFIGLSIIGVDYALVLGIMSGILNLIPYVGFYASLVISLIVATVGGPPFAMKLFSIAALYVGLNAFESLVLSPKIIGPKVGLHPVVLILSLVVFGYFLGFVGLLIAVPATAVLLMVFRTWEEQPGRLPEPGEAEG